MKQHRCHETIVLYMIGYYREIFKSKSQEGKIFNCFFKTKDLFLPYHKKIPHTGDTESINLCG